MVKDGKVMVITNVMYLKRNEMIEKLWIFLMFQGGGGGGKVKLMALYVIYKSKTY